jgi:hypothetical protein
MRVIWAVFVVVGFASVVARAAEPPSLRWYRGNTHAHTVRCGHADSEPEAVAKWYLDHEYNFLCLSEHNQFIDPATVDLPNDRRKDFILIPGEEITGANAHMTGLNMTRIVNHLIRGPNGKVIQTYVDAARELGGTPIINHPNFRWALKVSDIRSTKNCYLFELWNAHPTVNNNGDATRPSTERMWDDLLTNGMVIYGISSDDTHELKAIDRMKSNPGRGWVMVHASRLTPKAISEAMDHGEFYATSGVMLRTVESNDKTFRVVVDESATDHEVAKPSVIGEVLPPGAAKIGYQIEFLGPAGSLLGNAEGSQAMYGRDAKLAYFRARITLTREVDGQLRRYRAWTQPVFQDGRTTRVEAEARH